MGWIVVKLRMPTLAAMTLPFHEKSGPISPFTCMSLEGKVTSFVVALEGKVIHATVSWNVTVHS